MTQPTLPPSSPDPRVPDDGTFLDHHPGARLAAQALGTTAAALGGAVAGGVLGIAAGPVGSLAGAAAGAALGGMAGSGLRWGDGAEATNATDTEPGDGFWRAFFTSRPYVREGTRYEDWAPAYRYGAEAYARHAPMVTWSEAEARLGMGWEDARGESPLHWDEARHAAHDAWEHLKQRRRLIP